MTDITLYTYNLLEDATVTVTGDPDTGFPEARLWDRSIGFYWQDTATGAYTFHADQGAAGDAEVNALIVGHHNFDGEDLQFQWSTDDFSADINDAVTDWTQSGNDPFIKTLSSALEKRYWRMTVSSLTDPRCSELWFAYGWSFPIKARELPVRQELANVRWQRSVGGSERSTKFGTARRRRQYSLTLDSTALTNWHTATGHLDEWSLPFWLTDDAGDTFLCRFVEPPSEPYYDRGGNYVLVDLAVVEIL